MAFFFKPPRGNIALHIIQNCVHQRLQYLMSLFSKEENCYLPENFEYLITGSSMDRVGHYMLRLLSILSPQLREFVVMAERNLFSMRLERLNPNEILTGLRFAIRHISETLKCIKGLEKFEEFLLNMKHICKMLVLKHVIDHVFTKDHALECEQYTIHTPFTMCLPLVRQRRVSLKNGIAEVPCGLWKLFLAELFEKHVIFGMEQLVSSGCFREASQDIRIRALSKELKKKFIGGSKYSAPAVLKACDVDTESAYFPLCMAHLHHVLRSQHRLSHEARRHYSLFLKDIGMPVEEAMNFWSSEYSQPRGKSCGGCCHSWQSDARRYHYGIRHMYGLEGGRYNYKVPSCSTVQATSLQPLSQGGCPFKNFDEDKLMTYFPPQLVNDVAMVNNILHLRKSSPNMACHTYILALVNTELREESCAEDSNKPLLTFSNPAQYYFALKCS